MLGMPTIKIHAYKPPKLSGWSSLVNQQNRRTTGVTPRLTDAYQERPARWIQRSKSLGGLKGMASKGRKIQGIGI